MYDLSAKFESFYRNSVVLPQTDLNNLRAKATLNIDRLKSGLYEYNNDNVTNYSIVETCIQGSVAMYTTVQNDSNDYDVDVAIVFDKAVLGNMGPRATRNMVADAIRRKTKQFSVEPEVKTSCVRIRYADGYHVDFAVYRRDYANGKYIYEHAGAAWQERELRGITEWFERRNNVTDKKLRYIIRLSKMFCKSRASWKMPSGLIQTVVIDECLKNTYARADEIFYWSMKAVIDRIDNDAYVAAPVDNGRALVIRESDRQKMINWKNRLESKLADLDILFDTNCTETDAISAWACFFNHDYWNDQAANTNIYSIKQDLHPLP